MQEEFSIEYELHDLFQYAEQLAKTFNVDFVNDTVQYPEDIAIGGSKFFKINEYISFQLVHFKAVKRMVFKRKQSANNHITVSIQDFTFAKCPLHKYDCNEIIIDNNSLGSVQCKSTSISETVVVEAGKEIKVIFVLLKEHWIENVLRDTVAKEKFYNYLGDSRANLRKEFLTPDQIKLIYEIFNQRSNSPLEKIYYESRVLNLLESFLTDVLTKDEGDNQFLFANVEDIKIIQKAEAFIATNIHKPFAGVEYISKMCFMSRTKFINLFQKVYGLSSFDYYQKKRLNMAYDALKTGRHSVADIAENIGYSSVSNFTTAFKKEFGVLPKDFLYQLKEQGVSN
jgi:AraC-like DNA-binding protein/predicted DNA-binding protein (MmcQ/YjbR family)